MNLMEPRIIYHVDKFVSFLFGVKNENDPEQRIYNKLLRLEGEELEIWINKKVKKYITGKGYLIEFQRENFEGIDGRITFQDWYWYNISNKTGEVMGMREIYEANNYISVYFKKEYKIIKIKLQNFKEKNTYYYKKLNWEIIIFMDYLEMYIMNMNAENLKSYIIQQVDPIEIK